MIRLTTVLVVLLASLVRPVDAATITNAQLNGNLLNDYSGVGSLQIDTAFFGASPIVLTVRPDAPVLSFNNLVSFLLANGAPSYRLTLGGGATWNFVGSVDPITATSVGIAASATSVALAFTPAELIEVDLGDVGFGGADWRIGTSQVAGTFSLTLQVVPEPTSMLLVAGGLLAAMTVRRRGAHR